MAVAPSSMTGRSRSRWTASVTLRSSGAADRAGDLFDRDAFVGQQRDEAVPQLAGCPGVGFQTGGGGDLAEGASDVVRASVVVRPPARRTMRRQVAV